MRRRVPVAEPEAVQATSDMDDATFGAHLDARHPEQEQRTGRLARIIHDAEHIRHFADSDHRHSLKKGWRNAPTERTDNG